MKQAALALILGLSMLPIHARAEDPPPPEELRVVMARRFTEHTGVPLSIEALQYNVFTSTFAGKGIRVGSPRGTRLRMGSLELKASMSGLPRGEFERLKVTGVRGKLPGRRLVAPPPVRPGRAVAVGRAVVEVERLVFTGKGGAAATLEGAVIKVDGLSLPATGDLRKARGSVYIAARQLTVGEVVMSGLVLEGTLGQGRLKITSLAVVVAGGIVDLSGRLELKKGGLGGLDLAGIVVVSADGALTGKVRLHGKTLTRLQLSGALKGDLKPSPRAGKAKAAPPVKLKVKLGRRRLTGTLKSWRIR